MLVLCFSMKHLDSIQIFLIALLLVKIMAFLQHFGGVRHKPEVCSRAENTAVLLLWHVNQEGIQ